MRRQRASLRPPLLRGLPGRRARWHMFNQSPHAATYAAKAVGLHGAGKAGRDAERTWQWENLAPELRAIGFPKGL